MQVVTPEKLNAIWTLLEAFGNARTHMNINATRFTHIFSLDFDQSGAIASASIQVAKTIVQILMYFFRLKIFLNKQYGDWFSLTEVLVSCSVWFTSKIQLG